MFRMKRSAAGRLSLAWPMPESSDGVVSAETPTKERKKLIDAYRAGHIMALVNVVALGTGFDAPATDLIALVRALSH